MEESRLPGLDAEAVLDEDGDGEEDHTLHRHGKQVLAHHVPRQGRAEAVLTWRRTMKKYV